MTIFPLVIFAASGIFATAFFRNRNNKLVGKSFPAITNKLAAPKSSLTNTALSMSSAPEPPSEEFVVRLQHPGSCTGMFWRGDPYTNKNPPSNDNWPRNGALLRGTGPFDVRGEKYFKVSACQQAGTTGFVSVPEGTWMLYNQGGLLLHKVD